ncbi:molybdopterin molybdochelatase [Ureibacillus xyleni]|uniref:Molybdopterin molybdenumtransferase n=1 Tax=Ureibacillus xyleni TaxID=614648 RepID=A0A285S0E0_9BACL|nr:gephyrin-like molybdotransferase Glp [Ureibacillus xyleni]SOB99836.1 molybdopterin molybdochelatase [Ureibacillus xyleni]
MVEIRRPIQVNDALEKVLSQVIPLEAEEVELSKSYGTILAEAIIAPHDVPLFNRSPYDGYAIRSVDSIHASGSNRILFHVVGHIGAGDFYHNELRENEAVRIMTGAALPYGADAVVMFEQTIEKDNTFTIRKPFRYLENVSLQGEDAKKGEELISKGQLIHPGVMALLATFGYAFVKVSKKPKVGILCTGSELLQVNDSLQPGKIRNSNGPMIEGQLARMGIEYKSYGILPDHLEDCQNLVRKALDENDCVITTGGVSVGDFDFIPKIYKQLNAQVLFNKVAMRPGSVTSCAVLDGKLLFGLSGNPSACYIGFEIFTRPALQKMMGNVRPFLPQTKAVLLENYSKPNPFTRFIRSIYSFDGNQATILPAGFNKSNAVSSIAKGNAFMVLPSGTRSFKKGDVVDVLLLGYEDGVSTWNL